MPKDDYCKSCGSEDSPIDTPQGPACDACGALRSKPTDSELIEAMARAIYEAGYNPATANDIAKAAFVALRERGAV